MKKFNAVIIIGSGFAKPDSDEIDSWAKTRAEKAIEIYRKGEAEYIIVTGTLVHPRTGRIFLECVREYLESQNIPEEKILTVREYAHYPANGLGNILQAIDVMKREGFQNAFYVTERPHSFRCSYWLRRETVDLGFKFKLRVSRGAPVWYWLKEVIKYAALVVPRKHEKSNAYWNVLRLWDQKFAKKYFVVPKEWKRKDV